MMFGIIQVELIAVPLSLAVSLSAIVAVLRYTGLLAEGGWGTRFILVAAAFMILAAGFEILAVFTNEVMSETLAKQVRNAGIYLGYSVGGATTILGAVLIALKSFLTEV